MKLDKAQLAHDFILAYMAHGEDTELTKAIRIAWKYADTMQAEADKRVAKGVPELLAKNKDSACTHIHTTLSGNWCFDCEEFLE